MKEKIKIVSDGIMTKLYIDGFRIRGLQEIKFNYNPYEVISLDFKMVFNPKIENIERESEDEIYK